MPEKLSLKSLVWFEFFSVRAWRHLNGFARSQKYSLLRCQNEGFQFDPSRAVCRAGWFVLSLTSTVRLVQSVGVLDPFAKERNHAGYEYAAAV